MAFLHDIYRIIYEKIRETCSNKIYLTCISRETRVGHFETRVVFRDGYKRFTRVSGFFDERTGKGCCFDGLMGYALHMHEHCNYLDSLFASTVALALLHSLPLTSTNRGKLPL